MSSRRRVLIRVVAAFAGLALVTSAIAANAGWQRMEDVTLACASVFEEEKTKLVGYHWEWIPPAWVCDYRDAGGETDERRLPFGRR